LELEMINFLNSIREHILNKFRKVQVTLKLYPSYNLKIIKQKYKVNLGSLRQRIK